MRQALSDKALVVRAEAATRIGRRYDGSGDAKIVELLTGAYKHHGNSRNGKPLFVQNRILYALHQVGGKDALAEGKSLAGLHPETKSYWTRLVAVDDGSTAAK